MPKLLKIDIVIELPNPINDFDHYLKVRKKLITRIETLLKKAYTSQNLIAKGWNDMKNVFFELLLAVFLAVFGVIDLIKITPSYKVTYKADGKIAFAQCKKTGKFVKHSLVMSDIKSYFA